jgi:hypothetical protein
MTAQNATTDMSDLGERLDGSRVVATGGELATAGSFDPLDADFEAAGARAAHCGNVEVLLDESVMVKREARRKIINEWHSSHFVDAGATS